MIFRLENNWLKNNPSVTYLYAYQALFLADLGKDWVKTINRALEFSMPLGGSRFQQQIEKALGRKLGQAYRGRPKKAVDDRKTSGGTLD